jgi:hypothetical protein
MPDGTNSRRPAKVDGYDSVAVAQRTGHVTDQPAPGIQTGGQDARPAAVAYHL